MAILTTFVTAVATLTAGAYALKKRKQSPLVQHLVDQSSPITTVDSTATPSTFFSEARQLYQDLFGDTRQQYQQALNTTYDVRAEQVAERVEKHRLIIAVCGLFLATTGVFLSPLFYLPSIGCVLYVFQQNLSCSYRTVVQERRLDYMIVWIISIPIALVSGYVWAASFGAAFGMIGRYLVAKTENRSKQRITDLFGGQVRVVWRLVDGMEVETPIERIQVGDMVVVQAGQMIVVDGTIVEGSATVDQHILTGESQPVEKEVGDTVLSSTMVLLGQLLIQVEQAGESTVAAQITHILNQTDDFRQTLQSRTERMLNQMILPLLGVSAVALPITGVAGAVAVLWYYPGYRMMFFGPLSMLSYLQIAAQQGILVKDGRALEVFDEVDTIVFDKTGTLTLEQPTVSRIVTCSKLVESDILRYAAAAEAKQSHPFARAILKAAADRQLEPPLLDEAEYKVGYGLKTKIEGQTIWVGSFRFMELEGLIIPSILKAHQAESQVQGHSMVLVAMNGEVVGGIELQPTLRPEASAIIELLQARGLETVIISGDNETPTRQLAAVLGIDRYFAEVLPEDKANLVKQLQTEGNKVCFVGDGINDSIALKTADIAISLRGATTIATDTAQIVFMDGTLGQLSTLFKLTDEFAETMRLNMAAAFIPGIVGIAGTLLFGWGVVLCVLIMQGSTPVGIYNALKPLLNEHNNQSKLLP